MATDGMMGEADIEALVTGQFLKWRGLRDAPADRLPACLRATGNMGWLPFPKGLLQFEVLLLESSHLEVWLFKDEAGKVCLLEVYGLKADPSFTQILDDLGPPDFIGPVPLAAKLQRPTYLAGSDLIERVYARRGMALAARRGKEGLLEIVRVRGFEVMPASQYWDRFVELPATRFFEQE